jgi:hypothetical protein
MAKIESPYCPECDEAFDYPEPPPVGRRDFLRATAAGAAATALVGAAGVSAVKADTSSSERKAKPAEDLVRELFASLKDDQKKKVVHEYDHVEKNNSIKSRHRMVNAPLLGVRIGDAYTKAQQELVEKIVKSLSSGDDGYYQISREGTWDASKAFTNCGALFFGEPTKGNKFAFVFSGHHLTVRCDGDSEEGPAFGGPIYYGHTPYGYSADNCFYYQTKAVVKLYEALSGKQQQMATVKQRDKGEVKELAGSIGFRKDAERRGIPAGELSKDQLALAEEVMRAVLKPYRKEDVDEVMAIIKKNGGMEKIRFGFFPDGATNPKSPWHFWRLEGPGFVWNYRVLDHVHTYVNISSKLS